MDSIYRAYIIHNGIKITAILTIVVIFFSLQTPPGLYSVKGHVKGHPTQQAKEMADLGKYVDMARNGVKVFDLFLQVMLLYANHKRKLFPLHCWTLLSPFVMGFTTLISVQPFFSIEPEFNPETVVTFSRGFCYIFALFFVKHLQIDLEEEEERQQQPREVRRTTNRG